MEKTSLDYQDVMAQMNELQLNVAEAETLKKDRDLRIIEFRKTIESLEAKANMALKKSTFLESESKSLEKELDVVRLDYEACSKNLNTAQDINKQTVEQLNLSIEE